MIHTINSLTPFAPLPIKIEKTQNEGIQDTEGKTALEAALKELISKDPMSRDPMSSEKEAIIAQLVGDGASLTKTLFQTSWNIFEYAFKHRHFGVLLALHPHYTDSIPISSDVITHFILQSGTNALEFVMKYYPSIDVKFHLEQAIIVYHHSYPQLIKNYLQLFKTSHPHLLLLTIDSETTKQLLENGADINAQDERGYSALHYLAEKDHFDLLGELLRHGADMFLQANNGKTPWDITCSNNRSLYLGTFLVSEGSKKISRPQLHSAIIQNDITLVRQISLSWDHETKDIFGDTAVRTAIRYRLLPSVQLLSPWVSPNDLYFAARMSSVEVVSFLVDHLFFAKNIEKNIDKTTITKLLEKAEEDENREVVHWIIDNFTSLYSDLCSDLYFLCKCLLESHLSSKYSDLFQQYIAKMNQSEGQHADIGYLFFIALKHKETETAHFLLDFLIDDSYSYDAPWNVCCNTFRLADSEIVEKAIKKPFIVDVFLANDVCVTTFYKYHPVLFHKLSCELFEQGFLLCQYDNCYLDAVMTLAIYSGRLDLVEKCYTHFFTTNHKDFNDENFLEQAINAGQPKLVSFFFEEHLMTYDTSFEEKLKLALQLGNNEVIETLVQALEQYKIPINYTPILEWRFFQNLLPQAPIPRPPPLRPLAIEPQDSMGKTELFRAVETGNFLEVKKLLALGCNPNHQDSKGTPILEALVQWFSTYAQSHDEMAGKRYSIIDLLVHHGASCRRSIGSHLNIFDWAFSQFNYGVLFALHTYYKPHILITNASLKKFYMYCEVQDLVFIIKYYPNIELKSLDGYTLCHTFIERKRLDLLKTYAELAPGNFKRHLQIKGSFTSPIYSLLVCASQVETMEIASFLRAQGASFHHDPRLLVLYPNITEQLLKEGMDCNEKDHLGYTALHYICNSLGNRDCLPILLQSGADLSLLTGDRTATFDKFEWFHHAILKSAAARKIPPTSLPEEFIAQNPSQTLETAILYEDLDELKKQLLNIKYDHLTLACIHGSVNTVSFLIEHYFSTNEEQPVLLERMLFEAQRSENLPVALWLLEKYALRYLSTFGRYLLSKVGEGASPTLIQDCMKEMKKQPALHVTLGNLFIDTLNQKQLQMASFLLELIDDLSFFAYKLFFYRKLFKHGERQLIELAIKKYSIPNEFFEEDNALITTLSRHHPELFGKLAPELFERGLLLYQHHEPDNLEYLSGLMNLALNSGSLDLVEKASRLKLYKMDSDFHEDTFFDAILLDKEPIIRTILRAYIDQGIKLDFKNIYIRLLHGRLSQEKLKQEKLKKGLIWVLKIQRSKLSQQCIQGDDERLASLLIEISASPYNPQQFLPFLSSPTASLLLEAAAFFVRKLPPVCHVPCGRLSLRETVEWIIQEVLVHCHQMNPKLFSDTHVFDSIVDLVGQVRSNEGYSALFVALQTAPNKESASRAFQTAQALEKGSKKPTKELFIKSSYTEQKGWISYALVYRDRSFIPLLYHLIKQQNIPPDLLTHALNAIESIGVRRYNSVLENSIAEKLQSLIQTEPNEQIKVAALTAYVHVCALSHNPSLLDFFVEQFKIAREKHYKDFEASLATLLGTRYEWTSTQECEKAVECLRIGLESPHEHVRYQTAIALSAIPHEKGLFAALDVVQSHTWDKMTQHFGKDLHDVNGSFLAFTHRPEGLHDNRSAMIHRILYQLVRFHEKESHFFDSLQSPITADEMAEIEHRLQMIQITSTRYVGYKLFLPPKSDLVRGISTRKGGPGFREAVKDVLRKGAGSSQLTDYDTTAYSGTWNKIGHMFASHNKELYFGKEEGCPYFSVDKNGSVTESALIVFPAHYYQKELLLGEARLEREISFNNVLYRGIPHRWIKAVYLPERFKHDIQLLGSTTPLTTPLEEVIKAYTSDLFADTPLEELKVFRRILTSLEMDLAEEPPLPVSFLTKIRYFPAVDAKKVGELLQQDGVCFASVEEIKKETLLMRRKMSFLIKQHYKDPWCFTSQNMILKTATDQEIKEQCDRLLNMLPKAIFQRDGFQREEAKAILSKLQTDSFATKRAPMRMAALLYKQEARAKEILVSNPHFYGLAMADIPLVLSLIQNAHCNNKFPNVFVCEATMLQNVPGISFDEFSRMLFHICNGVL